MPRSVPVPFSRLVPIPIRAPIASALALALSAAISPPLVPNAIAQVDATTSFYVPQSGPVATPSEGTTATRFFRACPNNDMGSSLPNNARIKVVLKNAAGVPLGGIAAADICVLFNGGTAAQGFGGSGADSIVANATWNDSPLCPDVTCIPADADTDVDGVTYITFAGSTPGSPGVATRDPDRKWGHYDSHIPVVAEGVPLAGRLTTAAAAGSYVLRIKNFDFLDGLDAVLNEGEVVTADELTAFSREIGASSTLSYWLDFDSSGVVNVVDLNLLLSHINHDCDTPIDP